MEIVLKYFADFTPVQLAQFRALYDVYKAHNERINVISRKDIDSLYEKHVLHSLSIAAVTEFAPGTSILDIGTGGGFPGIPLAIFFPEVQFLLADSIAKKINVVDAVVKELGLTNVVTQNIRVEQIRNQRFDFTISRAVAPLKELWQWSKPLLRKNNPALPRNPGAAQFAPGLICLKGGDLTQEISGSGIRPSILEITDVFPEGVFKEKFLLYIPA